MRKPFSAPKRAAVLVLLAAGLTTGLSEVVRFIIEHVASFRSERLCFECLSVGFCSYSRPSNYGIFFLSF